MKSKTSCFNRTIFKKNLTHYWPLWVAYLGFMFLIGPFNIWQSATTEWYFDNYNETSRMHEIMYRAVNMMTEPIPIFVFAGAVALAVFSYLYSAKNANMMHALPVNRLELYVTNYLSGLSFLVIPQIIVFFVSVLVCLANEITCIQYLFLGLLCQLGLSFFAYSLAVFVAMFTGQLLAMPVYYLVLNYLYVGCLYIVNSVMELLTYGVTERWNPGKSCILSPLYYLNNNLWVKQNYARELDTITGIEIKGVHLVAIYAFAAVFITVIAYQVYRKRQIETAGDWISVGFVKPLFRWGVAFCGGILLSLTFTSILREAHSLNAYACTVFCMIVTGFICFFAAEMLLRKNFRVFKKKRFIEWAGFTVVAVLFLTLFEVDAFGIERSMPQEDEIVAAFVNMDYPIEVKTEDIPQLLELQHDAIAGKKEYQKIEQEGHGYYYTTFRYYLKDGSMFERRYPIPVTEEYVENENSPAAKILAWERKPENLKSYILGTNYDTNQYISGYIDLYNEDNEYRNYMFSEAETKALEEAVEKDIEEGNYAAYYLYSVAGDEQERYYNNISFDYYNRNGYRDIWDYYANYNGYYDTDKTQMVMEYVSQANSYITFGPECEYTIKALEELGITDDTWKLCTNSEYYD